MTNMENDKWTMKSNDIREWLKHNDAGAMSAVIAVNLDAGDLATTDEDRDRFWEAVRALCKTLPNSPIKKGRGSTLEPAIQACVDSVQNRIQLAFATISDSDLILEVMLPHGKTGGVYADIEAFAKDMATKAVRVLKAALKEDRWDGTMTDEGLTNMTPLVKETSDNEDSDDSTEESH
mgnify:FL=1|tara:strand:- start:690 stop:1223 length:534 start_codon:yes stop_codon:yes gene_type:complete